MTEWFSVCLGGAVGALCRFEAGRLASDRFGDFPMATLAVNVMGSFAMGFFTGTLFDTLTPNLPPGWNRLVLDGFLGALTTFSTFSMDTFRFVGQGRTLLAALNVGLNLVLCLSGVALGFAL